MFKSILFLIVLSTSNRLALASDLTGDGQKSASVKIDLSSPTSRPSNIKQKLDKVEIKESNGPSNSIEKNLDKQKSREGNSDSAGGNTKKLFAEVQSIQNAESAAELTRKRTIQKAEAEKYIPFIQKRISDGTMKKSILSLLKSPTFISQIQDPDLRNTMTNLLSMGLVEDVESSKYVLSLQCFDAEGNETTLSTRPGTPSSPLIGESICVDIYNFVANYIPAENFEVSPTSFLLDGLPGMILYKNGVVDLNGIHNFHPFPEWLLFGLFVHDHARHFGFMDEDHSLAAKLSRLAFAYRLSIFEGSKQSPHSAVTEEKTIELMAGHELEIGFEMTPLPGSSCEKEGKLNLGSYMTDGTRINDNRFKFTNKGQTLNITCRSRSGLFEKQEDLARSKITYFELSTGRPLLTSLIRQKEVSMQVSTSNLNFLGSGYFHKIDWTK